MVFPEPATTEIFETAVPAQTVVLAAVGVKLLLLLNNLGEIVTVSAPEVS